MVNDKKEMIQKTIDDYNGIVFYNEAFYLESILYSTTVCLKAFEAYETKKNIINDAYVLVPIVQEAVGHAAAVSRFFWPTKSKKINISLEEKLILKRRSKLKVAFKLEDSSVLFDRKLRNAWEHFDERLDQFLLTLMAGCVLPQAQIGNIGVLDNPVNKVFKLLDIQNECIVLLDEKYYFGKIRDEVNRIHNICNDFLDNGSVLPDIS